MLAHSPPLPLVIDYNYLDGDLIEEDEREITLALEQRERVRYLRLIIPILARQELITAIDGEYPMLEYLILSPPTEDYTACKLPKTLQAPRLRHLALFDVTVLIGSRLLITAVGLVTLFLVMVHPS